jgi:hypothetical protein
MPNKNPLSSILAQTDKTQIIRFSIKLPHTANQEIDIPYGGTFYVLVSATGTIKAHIGEDPAGILPVGVLRLMPEGVVIGKDNRNLKVSSSVADDVITMTVGFGVEIPYYVGNGVATVVQDVLVERNTTDIASDLSGIRYAPHVPPGANEPKGNTGLVVNAALWAYDSYGAGTENPVEAKGTSTENFGNAEALITHACLRKIVSGGNSNRCYMGDKTFGGNHSATFIPTGGTKCRLMKVIWTPTADLNVTGSFAIDLKASTAGDVMATIFGGTNQPFEIDLGDYGILFTTGETITPNILAGAITQGEIYFTFIYAEE